MAGLGLYLEPGPAQGAPTDKVSWPEYRLRPRDPMYGGVRCLSLACEQRGYCRPDASGRYPADCIQSTTEEMPGYGAPPAGTTPPPTATGGAFDFGALMSGTTFGLPTWLLIAGVAWFLFFRKGR
jgi:hypothetical protein